MLHAKLIILYVRGKQTFIYSAVSYESSTIKKFILCCTSLGGGEGRGKEGRGGEGRELPQTYQPSGSLDVYYHKPNESITF